MKNCDLCIKNDVCKIKRKGIKSCDRYATILASPKLEQIDIVALTEQLNGLIKSYLDVYNWGDRPKFINTEQANETRAELKEVLDNISQAIKGICCCISKL